MFRSVHVEAAARVANAARQAGVKRLVHVSGIGADANSVSPYIRSRGEGEAAVQAAFPGVVIIRPAVMFAPTTAFSRRFSGCFDGCRSILCLATAERDSSQCMRTAAAIVQVLRSSEALHPIYELAGPRVYSYKELLQTIAREAGLRPVFMQVPFGAWYSLASLAEILPSPLLTRSQVELMQVETTASNLPGFRELGISPRPLEQELQAMLTRSA